MVISELWAGVPVRTEVSDITFEKNFDVIVSGLGNSGSLAALFSAQNGLSVLGIENYTSVGGTTTIGGIAQHYFGCPGGRAEEVEEACKNHNQQFACDIPESGRFVKEKLLVQNKVELLYESSICGVYMEDNTVVGVRVITPNGIHNYGVRVLMDCTGDGCIAAIAGCDTTFGRSLDGLAQPYSRVQRILTKNGITFANQDYGRVDPRDDKALSDAMIFSYSYTPPYPPRNFKVLHSMPLIGLREGRHIVAEETCTLKDIFNNNRTKEPAFYSYSDFDKHGWDKAFECETLADWSVGANLNAYTMSFPVPWRSIIPKGFNGLLVPCRALGVDCDVACNVRMIPDMNKLAEVAADVALLSIRGNCAVKDIPYDVLRQHLEKSGCLNKEHDKGIWVDGVRNFNGKPLKVKKVKFYSCQYRLKKRLSTLTPGTAIWSAKKLGKASWPALRKLLNSKDENTKKHAAIALAAAGDIKAAPILREIVEQRDGVMLRDCRKYNQHRGPMAIYHLGRLADKESVNVLAEILTNPQEHLHPVYTPNNYYSRKDFLVLYFMFVHNAVAALIRIGDAHPSVRQKIINVFKQAFDDGTYYDKLTTLPYQSSEGGMVKNLSRIAKNTIARWSNQD